MDIKTKYNPEEWVYLVHDPEQHRRMITEFRMSKKGRQYLLVCGAEESLHFEYELSRSKDEVLCMNLKDDEE